MKTPEFKCPVALTARVMSGKWKPRILYVLLQNEKLRFSELRRECPPISDRMLSLELKELAKLYQRTVASLTGEESPSDLPADVAHLARTATKMTETDRNELTRFAEFLHSRTAARGAR